jgi:hypothetical protein
VELGRVLDAPVENDDLVMESVGFRFENFTEELHFCELEFVLRAVLGGVIRVGPIELELFGLEAGELALERAGNVEVLMMEREA